MGDGTTEGGRNADLELIEWSTNASSQSPPPRPCYVVPSPRNYPSLSSTPPQTVDKVDCCLVWVAKGSRASCMPLAAHRDPIILFGSSSSTTSSLSRCCHLRSRPPSSSPPSLSPSALLLFSSLTLSLSPSSPSSSTSLHRRRSCRSPWRPIGGFDQNELRLSSIAWGGWIVRPWIGPPEEAKPMPCSPV